jgi:tRNA (guanosine-2'-O-)-methyltransferase
MFRTADCTGLNDEERLRRDWLVGFLTPARIARLTEVLRQRTRHLTVVLDDIHQVQNISALLRSCEALGIQDVHVIEIRNALEPCPQIAMGAEQWLSVQRYAGSTNVQDCIGRLKESGYRIVVTSPHADAATPATLPIDRPLALVMGNETDGVRDEIVREANDFLRIDMCGFTESFNLSVAAAICLSRLRERLEASSIDWRLNGVEQERLLFEWIRSSLPHVEALERRYFEQRASQERFQNAQ